MEYLQSGLCPSGRGRMLRWESLPLTWEGVTIEGTMETQVKTSSRVPWLEQPCGGKRGRKKRRGREKGGEEEKASGVLAVLLALLRRPARSSSRRTPAPLAGGLGRGGAGRGGAGGRGRRRRRTLVELAGVCPCAVAAACAHQREGRQTGAAWLSEKSANLPAPARPPSGHVPELPPAARPPSHASRARPAPAAAALDPRSAGTQPSCVFPPG